MNSALPPLQPSMGLDFVIDDLACLRDGQRHSMPVGQLAGDALAWLLILMERANVPEREAFNVYRNRVGGYA